MLVIATATTNPLIYYVYSNILTAYSCLITEFNHYNCMHGFFNVLQVRVNITNRLGFVCE